MPLPEQCRRPKPEPRKSAVAVDVYGQRISLSGQRLLIELRDVQKALGMAANQGKGKDTWPKDMEKRIEESEDRLKAQLRNGIKER